MRHWLAVLLLIAVLSLAQPAAGTTCLGDCNADARVTVADVISMVNCLILQPLAPCCASGGFNNNTEIDITAVVNIVNEIVNGSCLPLPPAGG